MLQITKQDVSADPFPHVIKQPFLEPDLYARLKAEFPADGLFEREESIGGRSGRDIYRGDDQMEELLQTSSAWRSLHEFINSEAYFEKTLELFGDYFERFECKVSPAAAKFQNWAEPRENLVTQSRVARAFSSVREILTTIDPNDIYSRLDIHQGGMSYGKPIHCDRSNRLVSMIVYFCDADDIELEGGDLGIHAHKKQKPYRKYERHPAAEDTTTFAQLKPRENQGVFFLCSNNSYHSVNPITSQKKYRNFVYINLSSRAPSIW